MKKIKLTQRQVALVDDEDFQELNQYKWYANKLGNTFYAVRNANVGDGKRTAILMHRQIMQTPKIMITDHINHNGLDNRRENLRICTYAENNRNQKMRGNTSSRFKGVYFPKVGKKWIAQIVVDKKLKSLGGHTSEIKAAIAYNEAAKKYFGEFAYLNEVT